MYDSRLLLPVVRADLIIPVGDTVEMSVILQILGNQKGSRHDLSSRPNTKDSVTTCTQHLHSYFASSPPLLAVIFHW